MTRIWNPTPYRLLPSCEQKPVCSSLAVGQSTVILVTKTCHRLPSESGRPWMLFVAGPCALLSCLCGYRQLQLMSRDSGYATQSGYCLPLCPALRLDVSYPLALASCHSACHRASPNQYPVYSYRQTLIQFRLGPNHVDACRLLSANSTFSTCLGLFVHL